MTTGKLYSSSEYNYKYYHVYPGDILNLGEYYERESYYRNAIVTPGSCYYGRRSGFTLSFVPSGKETRPDLIKINLIYKKIEKSRPPCISTAKLSYNKTYKHSVSGMVHSTENNIGFDKVFEVYQKENHTKGTDYYYRYYHWIRIDDYSDTPYAGHIGTLTVGDSISDPYTDGYLHSADKWYKPDKYTTKPIKNWDIPADVDVFKAELEPGVYCVETEVENSVPLEITVYEADNNGYGEELNWIRWFNCYNNNGEIDKLQQRTYFELDSDKKVFVKINSSESSFKGKYGIRVLKTRPVILVHGIECYPKIKEDVWDGNNSMGHWEDYLPWDSECYPCVCYNFCWDSYINDIYWDEEKGGIIKDIVDCPPEQNSSVVKLYDKHKMDVVLIGHSMGGFFVRFALEKQESYDRIYKAITLGTPHYGSDIALIPLVKPVSWLKDTSKNNLTELRRGSNMAWEMHKWGGKNKLVCMAGCDAPPRVPESVTYTKGLTHSDGVVPVSSAFVEGADNALKISADHGTIAIATYVSQDKYPYDKNPSGLIPTIINRLRGNNKGQHRIPPELIIGDSKYNKVYKKVREYIK